METYTVKPIFAEHRNDFSGIFNVPGSKSITNRALMLAAMSDGKTTLNGIALSDDSRHFIQCLEDLGFETELNEAECRMIINGTSGNIPKNNVSINVGSAGTAARFLTAMLGCCRGTWRLDSSEQMKKRPMEPLIISLENLGCSFEFEEEKYHFPFTIHSSGISADMITVNIDKSSQFLSALLMACAVSEKDIKINVRGTHGLAYVRMTIALMDRFGINVKEDFLTNDNRSISIANGEDMAAGGHSYTVPGGGCVPACGTYEIEPDVSAAAYFYAMAAISGGSAAVRGVHTDSMQGDIAFLNVLENMGCRFTDTADGITLKGPENGALQGVDVDMSSFSDQALTLAAIAPFADSPVTIRGINHIRLQECDRIEAILHNLQSIGIRTDCDENDVITIYPGRTHGALIETYNDHRVAMSFAVTGLRVPGIVIQNPLCCRKTFENYFDIMNRITFEN